MSLNWNWSDRMGEITYDNGATSILYRGNALCIALNETDTTYSLAWFAEDKRHFENQLGLHKEYEACFENFGIKKFKLDTKYKETQTIVQLLAKARQKIEIELY